MFHIVAIGDVSSLILEDFQHARIKFVYFKDYKEFLSCRLTLKKIDAFLLDEAQKPKLIQDIKAKHPESVVLTINSSLDSEIALSFLQAGATDVLFKPMLQEDIIHRLLARLI